MNEMKNWMKQQQQVLSINIIFVSLNMNISATYIRYIYICWNEQHKKYKL